MEAMLGAYICKKGQSAPGYAATREKTKEGGGWIEGIIVWSLGHGEHAGAAGQLLSGTQAPRRAPPISNYVLRRIDQATLVEEGYYRCKYSYWEAFLYIVN